MLARKAAQLEECTTISELWDAFLQILAPWRIVHVIYITVDSAFENPLVLTNVGDVYAQSEPKSDPFLSHCCENYEITMTGADYLSDYEYLPKAAQKFIADARATGFLTGLGIPVRLSGSARFGGFNLGTALPRDAFEAKVVPQSEALRFLCLLCHRRIEELSQQGVAIKSGDFRDLLVAPVPESLSELSPREREVIYLVAQGISRKECARLCGISANTVAEYTKSAYRKLGIQNRVEATRLVLGQSNAA